MNATAHTHNTLARTNTILRSPISNFGGIPKSPIHGFGGQGTQYGFGEVAMNVNEDNLRALSGTDSDPITLFLSTINKLHFLTN